jgi:hypothetical protein
VPGEDRRNPYLMLGVPFGVSMDVVNKAFARASRSAKRGDSPYSVEDLTWALHQVEHASRNRDSLFTYFRVPADGQPYLDSLESSLASRPVPRPRRTEPGPSPESVLEAAAVQRLARRVLLSAISKDRGV